MTDSVPSIVSPSYAFTLTANTPVNVPVPSTATRVKFTKTSGDFYASAGPNGGYAPVAFTAAYLQANFLAPIAGGDSTGLPDESNVFDFFVTISGGAAQHILVQGFGAQTFTELLGVINGQLEGATASIVDGALRITTDAVGSSATIAYADGDPDLFNALNDFEDLGVVDGTSGNSPILNPDVLSLTGMNQPVGQRVISIASAATPTVSVTFY